VTPEERARRVKARALELGFTAAGITDLSPPLHTAQLDRWLDAGMAGTMRYMHRQAARRREPARIVPGTTRAVVVTRNYYKPDPPRRRGAGRIARYARGMDYHTALAEPLRLLADYLRSLGPPGTVASSYVDAGPVPERELAQRAGLGWIGKNTMLIDPERGSYTFLAAVLTDLDLAVDLPFAADRCGTCTRCLDACPTAAFPEPRVLDATRCISYLTIEYRGGIEPALASAMGDWIFGCDVCQEVCPWNEKFAAASDDPALGFAPDLAAAPLDELLAMDESGFARRFGHTAITRTGLDGMKRNATIASRNAAGGRTDRQIGG